MANTYSTFTSEISLSKEEATSYLSKDGMFKDLDRTGYVVMLLLGSSFVLLVIILMFFLFGMARGE